MNEEPKTECGECGFIAENCTKKPSNYLLWTYKTLIGREGQVATGWWPNIVQLCLTGKQVNKLVDVNEVSL